MNVLNSVSDEKVEDLFTKLVLSGGPTRFGNSCVERERERERFEHAVILIEIAKKIISCYNFKRLWQELYSCEKFVLNGV